MEGILKEYINDLAMNNEDMKNSLTEKGWTFDGFDPHNSIDDSEFIVSLYGRFKTFKGIDCYH